VGSRGGNTVIKEALEGKTLTYKFEKNGITFSINQQSVFTLESYDLGMIERWTVAYERFQNEIPILASGGYPNPYDPYTGPDDQKLPEPRNTILRSSGGGHLIEIEFEGKIKIEQVFPKKLSGFFHAWRIPKQ